MTGTSVSVFVADDAPLGLADHEIAPGYVLVPVRPCPKGCAQGLLVWHESLEAERAGGLRLSVPEERKHVGVEEALGIARDQGYAGLSCYFGDGRKQNLSCKLGKLWGREG